MTKVQLRHLFKKYVEKEVKRYMEVVDISGKLIRPDGTIEFWWNGVNYGNVIPEEMIDAELKRASKRKERKDKENERKDSKQE